MVGTVVLEEEGGCMSLLFAVRQACDNLQQKVGMCFGLFGDLQELYYDNWKGVAVNCFEIVQVRWQIVKN